jgi:hypothetical protein
MSLFQPGYLPDQTIKGHVFHATTGYAGVTIPIYSTTTAHTFALLNPAGSGKMLLPIKLMVGYGSATTPAISSLGLGVVSNVTTVGTGAAVTVFTDATIYNGRLGRTLGGVVRFASAAQTTSAATFEYELGLSQESATPGTGMVNLTHEFDGAVLVEPGTMISLVGAPIAPGAPLVVTLSYAELDYISV